MAETAHRAGVVALLGPPNAGKSTLLNALLGEKLSIVTRRPQTTRGRLLGIWTLDDAQVLLVDTPGLHEGSGALAESMKATVEEVAADCDLALLLVDRTRGWQPAQEALWKALAERRTPALLVGTKADLSPAPGPPWPPEVGEGAAGELQVSAATGAGLEALRDAVVARLPESPPLHPPDALSDRSLRFLAAECVREAAFEALEQELPYALAVEVVEFDESRPERVHIRANLIVARASQKRIAVGAGGAMIKRIGIQARGSIEALLGRSVHLALWVKVEPRWNRSPKRLKSLGYH